MNKGNEQKLVFSPFKMHLKAYSYTLSKSLSNQVCTCKQGYGNNYLCDRQQKVVIDGFSSNHETVNAGVPLGSFLGPFLFLLYINDICDDSVNNIRLFADDTPLYAIVENGTTNVAQSLTSDSDLEDK